MLTVGGKASACLGQNDRKAVNKPSEFLQAGGCSRTEAEDRSVRRNETSAAGVESVMMNRVAVAAVPLMAVALGAGIQSVAGPRIRGWEGTVGQRVDFVGACSFSEDRIQCWNENGEAEVALAERLQTFYRSDPDAELAYRGGRKNRVAVFRVIGDMSVGAPGLAQTSIPDEGGRKLLAVRFSADRDATEGSLALKVDTSEVEPVVIPLKTGEKATIGGVSVDIGDISESAVNGALWGRPDIAMERSCSFLVGWNASVTADPPFDLTPLDRDKKEIKFVDAKGRPGQRPLLQP